MASSASYFDSPQTETLGGFVILTRSPHKHLQVAWVHPQPPEGLLSVLLTRARFSEPLFGRLGSIWHYSFPHTTESGACHLVAVWGATFFPEKLLTLAKTLCDVFTQSGGSTVAVQKAWIGAFTEGRVGEAWALEGKFDPSKNFRAVGARQLVGGLGVDVVLVWAALMLRKRVAVVGGSAGEVIRAVRIFPLLVAHRYDAVSVGAGTAATLASPAGIMQPFVALGEGGLSGGEGVNECRLTGALGGYAKAEVEKGTAAQLADLAEPGGWVGGFTDTAVLAMGGQLWDVCVDLREKSVAVAEASKGDIAVGSVHKEFAKALLEALNDPACTDAGLLAALASKTSLLVDRLQSWLPHGIPLGLPASALPPTMQGCLPREGVVGDSASAVLRASFRDTLQRNGMGNLIGNVAGEGFLWGSAASEPTLLAAASNTAKAAVAGAV